MALIDFFDFIRRIWNFSFRFPRRYFRKDRYIPVSVPALSIEITNLCNSNCVFCANRIMKRQKQSLDMELFKKAIDEYVIMGGREVNFNCLIGEPLLDPYLLERARYVKSYSQINSLGFFSTLQWLHKFDIHEFLECGINWLEISTVLSGREKYLEFFGVDNYEQTLKNIVKIVEENNRQQSKTSIRFSIKPTNESIKSVVCHPDFKMLDALTNGAISYAVKERGLGVHDFCGYIKLSCYLRKRPLYPRKFRPCESLYSQLKIFSNGKIGVCVCTDFEANSELILGDIKTDTLKEVWVGRKLADLRDNWRKKALIPSICKYCSAYKY